jgi:hypothetical protein
MADRVHQEPNAPGGGVPQSWRRPCLALDQRRHYSLQQIVKKYFDIGLIPMSGSSTTVKQKYSNHIALTAPRK